VSIFKRIIGNEVFRTAKRCHALLTPKERTRAYRVAAFSFFAIFLDIAGLSMLLPVMVVAQDSQILIRPPKETEQAATILHNLFQMSGFKDPNHFLILMAAVLLVVFVLKNLLTLASGSAQARFSYDVATNLARRQYIKYYNYGYRWIKQHNSAEIVNNILNIPVFFTGGVLVSVINFMAEIAGLTLIVILIAVANYQLFIALMLVLVPTGILIYSSTKNRLFKLGQEQIKLGISSMSKLNHSIFGFVDVRLTNKETFFLDSYLDEQVKMNSKHKLKHVLNMIPSRGLEVIAVLGILVIFGYSALLNQGSNVFFFFLIFATAAFRALPSMNRALAAIMGMKSQLATLDILEEGGLPTKMNRTDIHPLPFEETIEFRNVRFCFEENSPNALENVSFTVRKGERIGIIGESGSGKTTLVNLLLRFLTETEGGIYVDGKKLGEEDVASWRTKVGYVQQHVFLLDASLKENVAFGESPEEINETHLREALEQASLLDFVNSLPQKWDTPTGEMGARLSGGQRQRIGIARALYYQSSVLVFDEATSALDIETENLITDSIKALQRDKTVFVVAHRLTTLRNCDRIMELKDGKLVATWTYPELVKEKMLK
jgi:ATP-binding cassette, subfamily B, bacterial PglK